jgi:hypothetical protein
MTSQDASWKTRDEALSEKLSLHNFVLQHVMPHALTVLPRVLFCDSHTSSSLFSQYSGRPQPLPVS